VQRHAPHGHPRPGPHFVKLRHRGTPQARRGARVVQDSRRFKIRPTGVKAHALEQEAPRHGLPQVGTAIVDPASFRLPHSEFHQPGRQQAVVRNRQAPSGHVEPVLQRGQRRAKVRVVEEQFIEQVDQLRLRVVPQGDIARALPRRLRRVGRIVDQQHPFGHGHPNPMFIPVQHPPGRVTACETFGPFGQLRRLGRLDIGRSAPPRSRYQEEKPTDECASGLNEPTG
jgi:hypothetical protein